MSSQSRTSIIGVVGDVTPAGEPDSPALYGPVEQERSGGGTPLARTHGDPAAMLSDVTNRRTAARNLALDRVRLISWNQIHAWLRQLDRLTKVA